MRIDRFTPMGARHSVKHTHGGLALAISWGDSGPKKVLVGMLALFSLAFLTLPPPQTQAVESPSVSVIVRHLEGAGHDVRETIRDLGGQVVRRLGIISSSEADLPGDKVGYLEQAPSVGSVTPNT